MINGVLTLRYEASNLTESIVTTKSTSNDDLAITINVVGEQLQVKVLPKKPITLKKVKYSFPMMFDSEMKVFLNGYQSWTDSHEMGVEDKTKNISLLAKPLMKKYQFNQYGDYDFVKYTGKRGDHHGFTYGYVRHNDHFMLLGSLSERNGYTIIKTSMKNNKVVLEKDNEGLVISSPYEAFDVLMTSGSESEVFDKYFSIMDIAKPKGKPMTGWTSWYNYYENISQSIIKENLQAHIDDEARIDIFQIDDGYQTHVGDWLSIDDKKFPEGMKPLVKEIHQAGYKAGIWLAPFVCEKDSTIFNEKPEWLQRDNNGNAVICGSNWSSFYALDIEHQEVRDYLRHVFKVVLEEWNFDMVKLDFLYGAGMVNDQAKTKGQKMCEAMDFLREICGEKLILGCGVPLGPAFGKVDYCRIGCDVGLDWDDKPPMRKLHRERISTLNAIGNTVGRRHLDGRAFYNDPDVFLLRDDNLSLTDTQKETLSLINGLFGSLLFTSDNLSDYKGSQKRWYTDIMNMIDKTCLSVTWWGKEQFYAVDNNDRCLCVNLSKQAFEGITSKGKRVKLSPYQSKMLGE